MYNWIDDLRGTKPEDILKYEERQTNGHDFCSAIIDNLLVTDKTQTIIFEAIRYRMTTPAFGITWYWKILSPKEISLDGFKIFYWATKDAK